MSNKESKRCKVGELRPSQAFTTFGIGAIIDLPNLSVMVMGLEEWPLKDTVEIGEQRLLASVKEVLGQQVKSLRSAPVVPDTFQVNPFDASALPQVPGSADYKKRFVFRRNHFFLAFWVYTSSRPSSVLIVAV